MRVITIAYRKMISAGSQKAWDKIVFEDTYTEFRMQAQYFTSGLVITRFDELMKAKPAAEKLHFLVSTAASGYVKQLNGIIPELADSFGTPCLSFEKYRFEIIQSDVHDKSLHHVAIWFYSNPMIWLDTIGTQLLVTPFTGTAYKNEMLTHHLQLPANAGIYSLENK